MTRFERKYQIDYDLKAHLEQWATEQVLRHKYRYLKVLRQVVAEAIAEVRKRRGESK